MRRNFAKFSSETKVLNLFAEIREFRSISAKFALISFAQHCITNISRLSFIYLLANPSRGSTLFCKKAGKSQNVFGCKNWSMRSRLFSYYLGYSLVCDDITQNERGRDWEMSGKFSELTRQTRWAFTKFLYAFSRSFILLVEVINQKRVRVFDRGIQTPRNRWNLEEDERIISLRTLYTCVWLLHLYDLRIDEGATDQILLLCAFNRSDVLVKKNVLFHAAIYSYLHSRIGKTIDIVEQPNT